MFIEKLIILRAFSEWMVQLRYKQLTTKAGIFIILPARETIVHARAL